MRRAFITLACAASVIAVSAHATPLRQNVGLTQGPPPTEIVSPYDSALECLATQLTPDQRATSFSAGSFPDRTARTNYVAESGVGNFSTSGAEDMIMTSLHKAGVQVIDSSPAFRQNTDWILSRMAMSTTHPANVSLSYPDVTINGAITTFDFLPGGGVSANIGGVQLGHQQSRILVGMDARAVLNLGSRLPGTGGQVVAADRPSKQIVGYEDSIGGSGFFGPRNSRTFVSLDFGHRPNEAIQFAERIILDRTVFVLVAQVFRVTACDAQLRYADGIANVH